MKTKLFNYSVPLITALILLPYFSIAQKAKKQSVSFPFVERPTIPASSIASISLTLHTKGVQVTADTIRSYDMAIENMEANGRSTGYPTYYSQGALTIKDSPADINFEVAYGTPEIVGRELIKAPCGGKENCMKYMYKVQYKLPAIVAVKDQMGTVLEAWAYAPTFDFKFGNESFNKLTEKENGFSYQMSHLKFTSEAQLNTAFDAYGTSWLNRKAVLRSMGHVIKAMYRHAFVKNSVLVFDFTTGKGKAHDYSDLTAINDAAIEIMTNGGDKAKVPALITQWESILAQADLENKKARINDVISHGIYKNISIAYLFLEDYDKAVEYAIKHRNSVPAESRFVASSSLSGQDNAKAVSFHKEVLRVKKIQEINPNLEVTEHSVQVPNFKKIYGKRKRSKAYNFTTNEDNYAAFKSELARLRQNESEALSEGVAPSPSENNPYFDQMQASTSQGFQLMLISLSHAEIVGKEMPVQITELSQLNRLIAPGMKFTAVPNSIGNLKDLVALNLKGSNLKELPESIGNLKKLKSLNLNNNSLTQLPDSIKNMTSLKSLSLKGNNISNDELNRIKTLLPKGCKIKI